MKLRNVVKRNKRPIAILLIMFLVGMIEVCFNYNALKEGYGSIDLTTNVVMEGKEGSERYVLSYVPEESVYIRQLRIAGSFESQYSYTVKTTEINDFGKEETKQYTDYVNACFSDFYTDINARVSSMEISLAKKNNAELTGVFISNQFEINKYRVLFFSIVFFLFYGVFFEKIFINRIENFFLVYGICFGILTIVCVQPVKYSWDEQIHFRDVYKIASGKNVEWPKSAYDIVNVAVPVCNTKVEYAQLRNYLNDINDEIVLTEVQETSLVRYNSLAYLPMAIFIKIGMFFQLPFSQLFYFGKMGNLMIYILLMFIAIRIAKEKKLFLAFLAMMPTVLFQASSYTYDSIVFSFITLGCVLWANEIFFEETRYDIRKIILSIALITVGSFSKAVYIPIILLMLLMIGNKTLTKKSRWIYLVGILSIFGLMMMTFVLPTFANTVAGNLSYGGDARGGDTGSVRQLLSMYHHLGASVKLMFSNIFALDNFRNLGSVATDSYHFINLMFLNFASLGILPDKWCTLLILVMGVLLFYNEKNQIVIGKRYFKWYKISILVTSFMVIGLIWLAMYLSFTPVGNEVIAGVQARYYLPLIYISVLVLRNNVVRIEIDEIVLKKILCSTVLILEGVAVFSIIISGRLY